MARLISLDQWAAENENTPAPEETSNPEHIAAIRDALAKVLPSIPPRYLEIQRFRLNGGSWEEVAKEFDFPSPDSARKWVERQAEKVRDKFPAIVKDYKINTVRRSSCSKEEKFRLYNEGVASKFDLYVEYFPKIPAARSTSVNDRDAVRQFVYGGNSVNRLLERLARQGHSGKSYCCVLVGSSGEPFRTGIVNEEEMIEVKKYSDAVFSTEDNGTELRIRLVGWPPSGETPIKGEPIHLGTIRHFGKLKTRDGRSLIRMVIELLVFRLLGYQLPGVWNKDVEEAIGISGPHEDAVWTFSGDRAIETHISMLEVIGEAYNVYE